MIDKCRELARLDRYPFHERSSDGQDALVWLLAEYDNEVRVLQHERDSLRATVAFYENEIDARRLLTEQDVTAEIDRLMRERAAIDAAERGR